MTDAFTPISVQESVVVEVGNFISAVDAERQAGLTTILGGLASLAVAAFVYGASRLNGLVVPVLLQVTNPIFNPWCSVTALILQIMRCVAEIGPLKNCALGIPLGWPLVLL